MIKGVTFPGTCLFRMWWLFYTLCRFLFRIGTLLLGMLVAVAFRLLKKLIRKRIQRTMRTRGSLTRGLRSYFGRNYVDSMNVAEQGNAG